MNLQFTSGNVDDRNPVPDLTKKVKGLLFGDKGYIEKELFDQLFSRGLKLITNIKKDIKNKLLLMNEKILLCKRSVVESVFNILRNQLEFEHTRHRSVLNAWLIS